MKFLRALQLLALALLVADSAAATAQTPDQKPPGFAAASRPVRARRQVIASADAATVLRLSNGAPACFAHGALISWKAKGGEMVAAWTLTASVAFTGGVDTADAFFVDDPTLPDGDGAGFSVAPSERVDAPTPTLDQLYRVPGAAHGVCNGMQAGPGDHVRLVPCRDNPSCVVARAGTTCDLTAGDAAREARLERLRAGGCAFVIVQTDTPGASITWELQQ